MNLNLKIMALCAILAIYIAMTLLLRKNRISVKYSIVWYFSATLLLLTLLIPGFLEMLTHLTGFVVSSNMIFSFLIVMLIFINISLTVIVSNQSDKIRVLIQEVSILKAKKK